MSDRVIPYGSELTQTHAALLIAEARSRTTSSLEGFEEDFIGFLQRGVGVKVTASELFDALRLLEVLGIAIFRQSEFTGNWASVSVRKARSAFDDFVSLNSRSAQATRAQNQRNYPVIDTYFRVGEDWVSRVIAALREPKGVISISNEDLKEFDPMQFNVDFFKEESNVEALISESRRVINEVEVSSISNFEKAQAKSLLAAVIALSEAPEPPSDLIWKILERANTIAGIASFFVSILALVSVTG